MNTLLLLASLLFGAIATTIPPSICLANSLELKAGVSMVSAQFLDAGGRRCVATVVFDNTDFLPLVAEFEPTYCDGLETASFQVPSGVPDGSAIITWQCAGSPPTCIRAGITGGDFDLSLPLLVSGFKVCGSIPGSAPALDGADPLGTSASPSVTIIAEDSANTPGSPTPTRRSDGETDTWLDGTNGGGVPTPTSLKGSIITGPAGADLTPGSTPSSPSDIPGTRAAQSDDDNSAITPPNAVQTPDSTFATITIVQTHTCVD